MNSVNKASQSHHACCCDNGHIHGQNMWSRKKKIRVLEVQLKELNEQKTDLEDLIEELTDK